SRWRRCRSAATSASVSRTTSIFPTARWPRAMVSSWPRQSTSSSSPAVASRASTRPNNSCGLMATATDLPGARGELGAELLAALGLARAAGDEGMKLRGGELDVELKKGNEPVTIADKRASELIVDGLRTRFPGDRVISEELALANGGLAAAAAQPRMWLV